MPDRLVAVNRFVSSGLRFLADAVSLQVWLSFCPGLCAQEAPKVVASTDAPIAPASAVMGGPSSSLPGDSQSPQPGPELAGSGTWSRALRGRQWQKSSQADPIHHPNYRAVSADANVAPLDDMGKSSSSAMIASTIPPSSTWAFLPELARRSAMCLSSATAQTPIHATTAYLRRPGPGQFLHGVPAAGSLQQDPRYFTKDMAASSTAPCTPLAAGHYAHRQRQLANQLSEVIGNGAAAGISACTIPALSHLDQDRPAMGAADRAGWRLQRSQRVLAGHPALRSPPEGLA